MGKAELIPVVDARNRIIGVASRKTCHSQPALIHCTVHILILNSKGKILLQKRSRNKKIQPFKWDTSVGGHLRAGENYYQAARRELDEELGIRGIRIRRIYDYLMRNEEESESIRTYMGVYDGPFEINRHEIDQIKFWGYTEIRKQIGKGVFTPNFEDEFRMFLKWQKYRGRKK